MKASGGDKAPSSKSPQSSKSLRSSKSPEFKSKKLHPKLHSGKAPKYEVTKLVPRGTEVEKRRFEKMRRCNYRLDGLENRIGYLKNTNKTNKQKNQKESNRLCVTGAWSAVSLRG